MTVQEILQGNKKEILANIDLLAEEYMKLKGKKLNKGCPACVIEMVLTLKNFYKMTQFKFKRHAASYKNKKGDKTTISNSTMTDEKAIAFLKTDPKRIELFLDYPSNWKKLIAGEAETEEQKAARLAVEAEAQAAKEGKNETEGTEGGESGEGGSEDEGGEGSEGGEGTEGSGEDTGSDTVKAKKEDLLKMQLKELREKYPDTKATSIEAFVEKLIADGLAE